MSKRLEGLLREAWTCKQEVCLERPNYPSSSSVLKLARRQGRFIVLKAKLDCDTILSSWAEKFSAQM